MFLNSTSDLLTVITAAAGDIQVHASWADKVAATEPVAGRTNTASITTATTTTIVGSPAANTTRKVKYLNLHNNHATVAQVVRLAHTDGTNTDELIQATLLPNESLIYSENVGWIHYNRNGADYAYILPFPDVAFGMAGAVAETIPRNLCQEVNTAALTSGTLYMAAIYLRAGEVVSSISFMSATTAAGTPTNGFFGLYSAARAKLAESANFTTEAWAAQTLKTKEMTTPYVVPTSGLYYLAIMITATTVPTLKGHTALTGGQLHGTAPILHGNSDAGLTTSIPAGAAAITADTTVVWGMVS